jgi:hypothetical protein
MKKISTVVKNGKKLSAALPEFSPSVYWIVHDSRITTKSTFRRHASNRQEIAP